MAAPVNLTDNSIMPFGKFAGKKLIDVPAVYLLWLYDKGCSHSGIKNYILNNMDVLRAEISRIPKRK